MYCGQTAGWITMSLGTEVGLGQAALCYMETQFPSPPNKGHSSPQFPANVLWPKGWIDQDATL